MTIIASPTGQTAIDGGAQRLTNHIRVLVVDDNIRLRWAVMESLLAEQHFELVEEASNGDEALRKAITSRPDVVLMDLQMPVCDGVEATRRLQAEKPDVIILDIIMPTKDGFAVCQQLKDDAELSPIPVLMLTSFAADKGKTNIPESAGLTLEAEDYVDKPVQPEELLKRVGKLLKESGL